MKPAARLDTHDTARRHLTGLTGVVAPTRPATRRVSAFHTHPPEAPEIIDKCKRLGYSCPK